MKRLEMNLMESDGYPYKFEPSACASCGGACCTGASGYIWVKHHEIKTIAEFLELSYEDFAIMYLKKVKHRYSLIEKYRKESNDFACIFFDSKIEGCGIYSVRPLQCRTFPFWEQFKNSCDEVEKECPGIVRD